MAALSNPRCLFNSRAALQRVFLATPTAATIQRTRQLAAAVTPSSQVLLAAAAATGQVRTYAGPPPRRGPRGQRSVDSADGGEGGRDERRGFSPLYTTAQDIERSQKDRMPQDFEIKDPKIMVLENGSVAGPLSTQYVLSKLDAKTESLRMIRPYIPAGTPLKKGKATAAAAAAAAGSSDGGGAGGADGAAKPPVTKEEQFALCEIVNKFEAFMREKELKQRKKANAKPKTKEMELTWSISEHDLQTKLRQLGGFLSKGMKVNLVLGSKKGGKRAEAEEMQALVKRIKKEVQALDARETGPTEGEIGRTMRMHLEGVVKKQE
ncbi:hypothetical protein PWT90_05875 [Aphanocladium album]|nr:hypothetical protein PWT90_05875 [Aphanocladium album]